jgi:hypothetical protein
MAVVRPAVNLVVIAPARRQGALRRIEGQLLGLAAIRGHDVDLLIAVVLAGEGDPLAVGRELREQLDAGVRGQARGRAAGRVHQPQVAAVGERDAVIVDVRKAQELGLRGQSGAVTRGLEAKGFDVQNCETISLAGKPPVHSYRIIR